jgi:hypothetical protein
MTSPEYAAMMKAAHRHAQAAHDSGGCRHAAIRDWQQNHGKLSKAEIRLVLNHVVPRVITRKRGRNAA